MSTPILATKLYVPTPRPNLIRRPRLIAQLNAGLHGKLTLISAPAGFGKTTLVSSWINQKEEGAAKGHPMKDESEETSFHPSSLILHSFRIAWLSLDEADNDPARFMIYLVTALQTVAPNLGKGVLNALRAPQPPREPAEREAILTMLLNEIFTVPADFVLILDDYHLIEAKAVDEILSFLLKHLPPQMHLVIATREDPQLPIATLRARGQLTEVRVADLRFTLAEAADFLNGVMGLKLSPADIAALEARTEGWIAGLQLAAISMQRHNAGDHNTAGFIQSFTGSHRFVMDYLVEEVLEQQPESVQTFLLRTSILDRLCGPLCDAVLCNAAASGQATLEYLGQVNLFIVPLDNERRWYRYHHLFGELLRQRLHQRIASSTRGEREDIAEYHRRASAWYETNGLEIEAFHHATAAHDIARAERLIEGKGMPLHFRGAVAPVLNWLKSLPTTVLDAWPSLWTAYASTLLVTGQTTRVEEVLQAAEAALQNAEPDDQSRDLIGRIAAIRATAAADQRQVDILVTQSRRALEYLHPANLAFRTSTTWKLGYAYHLQGNLAEAGHAYSEVISAGQASGNIIFTIMATIGLGSIQETENQLPLAAQTYRRALELFGDQPLPVAYEAHLGLARIYYEWNDCEIAQQHAQQSLQLAQQYEKSDRTVGGEVLLARLNLAQGDVTGATALLAKAEHFAQRHHFVHRLPEIAETQVLILLHQNHWEVAAQLVQKHKLPLSQARVLLVQHNPSAALALLAPVRREMEAKGWADKLLKVLVLEALAYEAQGEKQQALQRLSEALTLAAPGGFIRLFVDEGLPMVALLSAARDCGITPDYTGRLLAAFPNFATISAVQSKIKNQKSEMVEPLSDRELEVLQLIAQGLSNYEISKRLFLALDTVKGHNRRIFGKLQVQRRTEAVARARELRIL